jgi:3' terminal RNA ribose 2'-O-methyltransferase Hen1
LGWVVDAIPVPLDPMIPAWGDSRYVDLRLRGTMTLSQALSHLYVLLPVLDNAKHYWVNSDEVDKLVRAGSPWLQRHPERALITGRYLRHQQDLVLSAVGRLAEVDDTLPDALDDAVTEIEDERPEPLVQHRKRAVIAALKQAGAARVVDLGCGEGALIGDLLKDASFSEILGVDVSHRALELAGRRLGLDRLPESQRARLTLLQSSLTYRDERFAGFDAVVLMEVIEHLDLPRLPSLEGVVFAQARPRTVIVTTPNSEFNVRFEHLAAGVMRHKDHRFEWTRGQFAQWASQVGADHGYTVQLQPIGEDDPRLGPPTQMAVFTRSDDHVKATS